MKTSHGVHTSVLLKEIVDGLAIEKGDTVVDATVNGGGMSEEILKRFGDEITLVALDADEDAIERAKTKLSKYGNPKFVNTNFRNIETAMAELGVHSINRAFFDLGLSSDQLESSGRGFSFLKDEPLLMTFEKKPSDETLTAYDIANHWDAENIETIIRNYGEDRNARRIAEIIVTAREDKPIETSRQLASLIEHYVGRRGRIHPATKTFQAFRMAVNDELGSITLGLSAAFKLLSPKGRIAVISFHSLEDRNIKHFMKERALEGLGKIITKKPITPTEEEITRNPRARSAKLRIIEKL